MPNFLPLTSTPQCGSEEIDVEKARILLDESFTTSTKSEHHKRRIRFETNNPTACWIERLPHIKGGDDANAQIQICLAIGMVCTNVIQTGGGGDNVSG